MPPHPPRVLLGPTRSRLLAVVGEAEHPMGVREIARAMGLHPNSVRDQLRLLVEAGLVTKEVSPPSGRGRPSLRYMARPDPDASEPYRSLARVLTEELDRSPETAATATAAGERWGRTMVGPAGTPMAPDEAVRRLIEVLDDAGFAPEPPADLSAPIRLRRCPFDLLARDHRAVVCGVHLGLMRGALRELEAPLDAVRLEPFVEPDLCLAHLEERTDG